MIHLITTKENGEKIFKRLEKLGCIRHLNANTFRDHDGHLVLRINPISDGYRLELHETESVYWKDNNYPLIRKRDENL